MIERQDGCRAVSLHRSLETPDECLLLVAWESVEAHTHGFRRSPDSEEWRSLLHHFYRPFPVVEHFAEVG